MKIRKIILENHSILDDLTLDFTNEKGVCLDTIILAGENGTGKTSILELLFEFSKYGLNNTERDEKRIFEVDFSEDDLNILKEFGTNRFLSGGFKNGIFAIEYDFNVGNNWNQVKIKFLNLDGEEMITRGSEFYVPEIRQIFRSIYSDVEINYTPRAIRSVTSKNIDVANLESYKSEGDLATEITQLIIDIQNLDSLEFLQWGKKNIGNPVDENHMDSRIKRFTNAFNIMFPSKRFLGIENVNNSKAVLFEENGKKMTIGELSSGEKQIVFRGSFLLKNMQSNKGLIVLIDEPEISLHPKWQIEILDFYKSIFSNEKKVLTSQMFIATHSPFIIHNQNRYNDKVIILSKDKNGRIISLKHPEFYSWTSNKIVKEAFQIDYGKLVIKGKLFLEGITDENYFKKTKEIFNLNSLDFDISWIGRVNNGNSEFTGESALNHTKSFFLANPDLVQSKIILYYDSDTYKKEQTFGNLLIRRMPLNGSNTLYEIGIENLLNLPNNFNKDKFYSQKIKKDKYGAKSTITVFEKSKLCDWICNDCSLKKQKEMLKNLEPLLVMLNK